MVTLIAATAHIASMLWTWRVLIKDAIATEALVRYAGAVFNVEPLVAVGAEGFSIDWTERPCGPYPLFAGALIRQTGRVL